MRRPVEALLVNVRQRGPGQLLGLDDDGMGVDVADSLLDVATGGTYKQVLEQIDLLSTMLKVTIVASLVAGIAGVAVLFRERR